jgi:hypothetical protein
MFVPLPSRYPEISRVDADFIPLLNDAAEIVANDLRQRLIHHRRVCARPHGIAELPLDHAEHGFHVAALD